MRVSVLVSTLALCSAATSFAPAALAQQPAQPTVARSETRALDSWAMGCSYGKDDKLISCVGSLRVNDKDNRRPLFAWTLRKGDAGKIVAVFEVPSGVRIVPGVTIAADKASKTFPFVSCAQACVATSVIDDDFIKKAAAAPVLSLIMEDVNGKPIKFDFPATGVDKVAALLKK